MLCTCEGQLNHNQVVYLHKSLWLFYSVLHYRNCKSQGNSKTQKGNKYERNSNMFIGEGDYKLACKVRYYNLPSSVPQYLTFMLNVMAAVANSKTQQVRTRIFGNSDCNTQAAEIPRQSFGFLLAQSKCNCFCSKLNRK